LEANEKEHIMEHSEKLYVINHLTLITGLSDRTIRNHLAQGILRGEMINGMWHFTPEQVTDYVSHPAVRPSIAAKHHSIVYDFLADTKRSSRQTCMILDLPDADPKDVGEYFGYTISDGDYHDIRFAFNCFDGTPRVILSGDTQEVLRLVNSYRSR
jgi:hypothetical protein